MSLPSGPCLFALYLFPLVGDPLPVIGPLLSYSFPSRLTTGLVRRSLRTFSVRNLPSTSALDLFTLGLWHRGRGRRIVGSPLWIVLGARVQPVAPHDVKAPYRLHTGYRPIFPLYLFALGLRRCGRNRQRSSLDRARSHESSRKLRMM
jgi:hypothetical protein